MRPGSAPGFDIVHPVLLMPFLVGHFIFYEKISLPAGSLNCLIFSDRPTFIKKNSHEK
jgi:hypothetical protein